MPLLNRGDTVPSAGGYNAEADSSMVISSHRYWSWHCIQVPNAPVPSHPADYDMPGILQSPPSILRQIELA